MYWSVGIDLEREKSFMSHLFKSYIETVNRSMRDIIAPCWTWRVVLSLWQVGCISYKGRKKNFRGEVGRKSGETVGLGILSWEGNYGKRPGKVQRWSQVPVVSLGKRTRSLGLAGPGKKPDKRQVQVHCTLYSRWEISKNSRRNQESSRCSAMKKRNPFSETRMVWKWLGPAMLGGLTRLGEI